MMIPVNSQLPSPDPATSADPRRVRLPFLGHEVGSGDVVRGMTAAAGIQPCSPCEQRRQWMNRHLVFTPWGNR
jgi:hypothetical protein